MPRSSGNFFLVVSFFGVAGLGLLQLVADVLAGVPEEVRTPGLLGIAGCFVGIYVLWYIFLRNES